MNHFISQHVWQEIRDLEKVALNNSRSGLDTLTTSTNKQFQVRSSLKCLHVRNSVICSLLNGPSRLSEKKLKMVEEFVSFLWYI